MLFIQSAILLWSVIMPSSNAKLNLLLPLLIACDASFLPEKSLADNPEDLTDVQIQELINSSGMNQMEAEALEEEIYDLLDDCIEGDEDACDELSEIIEELEDDSEENSEDDDSEDNSSEDDSEDDDSEEDSEDDSEDDDSEDDSDSEDEDSEESSDDSEDDDSENSNSDESEEDASEYAPELEF